MPLVRGRDLRAPVTVVLYATSSCNPVILQATAVQVDPDGHVLLVGEDGRGLVALDGSELVLTVEAER